MAILASNSEDLSLPKLRLFCYKRTGESSYTNESRPMDVKLIDHHGLSAAIEEVVPTFFSRNRTAVEQHFTGHAEGNSSTLLGYHQYELIGIVTIRWHSNYPPFRAQGIPLLQYIEIKWDRRGQGFGTSMLAEAERLAATRATKLGICVGVFDAYGPAQHLYTKRGYVADGRGLCRRHEPLRQGETVQIDHDLLLWLIKDLGR